MKPEFIVPGWRPVPGVRAVTTTRVGGVSSGVWAGLNLGTRVGDRPEAVADNRRRLAAALALPAAPLWLRQVHGTRVVEAGACEPEPEADAAVARGTGEVLAVLSADCLPVFFASVDGAVVGLAHAGWRGLAAGVLERTLRALGTAAAEVQAWIGPGIGVRRYRVGAAVRAAFADAPGSAAGLVAAAEPGYWYCDLPLLARARLRAAGVGWVGIGGECTFSDSRRFYSYRRDGATGRMASLIWRMPRR